MAKFTNVDDWIKYNADYYCGSNISIFFGGIWVDDIVTFQYSASQSKVPLFGYSSQQFDGVAKGQFLIQGQFTLAFKEVGYLYLIMDRIRSTKTDTKLNEIAYEKRKKELQNLGQDPNTFDISRLDPAKTPVMGYGKIGNIIQPTVSRLSVERTLNMGPGEASFESMAEELEDSIWGVDKIPSKKIIRPDQFDLDGDDIGYGFDVLLTYGDINKPGVDHTVQSINNVHITDVSQVLMPTGDPIAEQYSFFARGLSESISGYNAEEKRSQTDKGPKETASFTSAPTPDLVVEDMIIPVFVGAYLTFAGHLGAKDESSRVKGANISITRKEFDATCQKLTKLNGFRIFQNPTNGLETYIYNSIVVAMKNLKLARPNIDSPDGATVRIEYKKGDGTQETERKVIKLADPINLNNVPPLVP